VKTKAAILWELNTPWSVEEIELDAPKAGEVLVKIAASGMCHSDEHVVTGDLPFAMPIIGGHEGAGVVEAVGPGVSWLAPGDHVVFGFIPSCGRCPSCSTGHSNLCDMGALLGTGKQIADGTSRHHAQGQDISTMCFSPGDTVVVVGIGGIGANAVQGAKLAGAKHVIAIDPIEFKREKAMQFGATHTAASMAEALPLVQQISWGTMANKVIMTMGVGSGAVIGEALALTAKRGRVVVTNIHPAMEYSASMSLLDLTLMEKQVVGSLFGSGNPRADIPKLISLYREGQLDLDSLISKTYPLEGVNDGYEDMRAGKNIRGVLVYS